MNKVNVLILGSGGREHALAWKISQSPLLARLFIAPGNSGTRLVGTNVPMSLNDFAGIKHLVLKEKINLVVVGPEEPLVKGFHDFFLANPEIKDIPVIGPVSAGAALEGSKDFAKKFMIRHGIPTAAYETFTADSFQQGLEFLRTLKPPYVLKADGLAAGKGVVICKTLEEASSELRGMLIEKRFGKASASVVIEEFLDGIELSAFALTDGNNYLMLPAAKDYKRVGVGDTGSNTGGMGSVSPVPFADEQFMKKVEDRIIRPTVEGLQKDGISYIGFIFAGLMNIKGDPFVIEYNVRLGDPETEVILPRIKSDFLEILIAMVQGRLNEIKPETDARIAACVMLTSGGYPGEYEKGKEIHFLKDEPESLVFHAGSQFDQATGKTITSGGRVIAVTSLGNTLKSAMGKSYETAALIHFDGVYYRNDIGFDLLN